MEYRRKLLRLPIVCVLVLYIVILLPGCKGFVAGNTRDLPTVRIAWTAVVGTLPLFVATERNLFQQNALVANTVEFTNSNDAVTALAAEQVDLMPAVSLIPIIHLEIQHPGTVRVFSHSRSTPDRSSDSIITKVDSPVESLKDLAGRRVGVFPGTSATKLLQAFLQRNQIPTDKITFVPLVQSAQISALTAGSIDALFGYEPTTTIARETGQFRVVFGSVYASLINPSPLGAAVISRSFEKKQPEAAKRAIAVFDDAVKFMRTSPESTKSLIPKFVSVEPKIGEKVVVVESGLSTENDIANLQQLVDLLYSVGEIPEKIDARRLVEP